MHENDGEGQGSPDVGHRDGVERSVGIAGPVDWLVDQPDAEQDAIQEAERIRLSYPNAQLIVPVAWHRFHDHSSPEFAGRYLNPRDLEGQIFFSREAGANGIYLWGNELGDSSADYPQFFSEQLDPLVRRQCDR